MDWPEKWTPNRRIEWLGVVVHDYLDTEPPPVGDVKDGYRTLFNAISYLPNDMLQRDRELIEPHLRVMHEREMQRAARLMDAYLTKKRELRLVKKEGQ